ncbi:MAG: 23S rRNA (adenine(2503)-C(2))-methyltransferase RlmN [Candidatus Methylacidiphilales bacterium]|nr:23S rRNA (adenine(2503)-C(2))-methyltransferase RlmN [Candidatus Methylacidiphilales bacterium]
MPPDPRPLLLDVPPADWNLGDAPAYRARQLSEWVFARRVDDFAGMSNLPAPLREDLANKYRLRGLELVRVQGAADTTQKLLFKLNQGDYIECVVIPASPALYGETSDRHTLCVSTQVGCAYGCKFCASGLEGWKRHLTPGEIIGQIMEAERHTGQRINNLVFMGMGEPLANFQNLMAAIDVINAPDGINLGARHITISTSGVVPRIRELADQPRQLRLAISLHGASNAVRDVIMPVNRKHPVEDLLEACAYFHARKKQKITFEYILIRGVNDAPEEARLLVRHARRLDAKVNLIPYNTVEGLPWERPETAVIEAFRDIVEHGGVTVTLRLEKGHDIDAACGQLRLKELQKAGESVPT